jgi:hypothetical protein
VRHVHRYRLAIQAPCRRRLAVLGVWGILECDWA